jgi:hypothetical protein
MNKDKKQDFFSEKNVEEQIEKLSASQKEQNSDTAATDKAEERLFQDLDRYRKEQSDEAQQALQRAWQRIAASQSTQAILKGTEPITDSLQATDWRQVPSLLSARRKPARGYRSYLGIATLVALLLLVIGSSVLITQTLASYRQTHNSAQATRITHGATPVVKKPSAPASKSTKTVIPTKAAQSTPVAVSTPTSVPTLPPASVPGNGPAVPGGGALLASDNFSSAGALNGGTQGSGWSRAWDVQNGDTSNPGYTIQSSNPLEFANLQSTNTYATGGSQYLTAGRTLDISSTGPFASYLAEDATNTMTIGKSGTTLWVSVLLRKENADEQPVWVSLNNEQIDWCATCTTQEANVGYFGSGSDAQGTRYWSLQVGGNVYRSSVPVVAGQTALLVMSINFGDTTQCQMYVNPSGLGTSTPAASSVEASLGGNFSVRNFDYYGGDSAGSSSLGNVRLGGSYAAVTPIN